MGLSPISKAAPLTFPSKDPPVSCVSWHAGKRLGRDLDLQACRSVVSDNRELRLCQLVGHSMIEIGQAR